MDPSAIVATYAPGAFAVTVAIMVIGAFIRGDVVSRKVYDEMVRDRDETRERLYRIQDGMYGITESVADRSEKERLFYDALRQREPRRE